VRNRRSEWPLNHVGSSRSAWANITLPGETKNSKKFLKFSGATDMWLEQQTQLVG